MTTLTLSPSGTTSVTSPTGTPMIVTSDPSKTLIACGKCAVTVRSLLAKGTSHATRSRTSTTPAMRSLARENGASIVGMASSTPAFVRRRTRP